MAASYNQATGQWEDDQNPQGAGQGPYDYPIQPIANPTTPGAPAAPAANATPTAGAQYDPSNPNSYGGSSNETFNNSAEGLYQQLLGRGSNSDEYNQWVKLYNPNDAASNYGANGVRDLITNSDAYKNKNTAAPPPAPGAPPPPGPPPPPASGQTQAPQMNASLQPFMDYLTQQRSQQDAQNASMRQILQQQIGQNSQPISVDSPGVKEMIAAQHLESQRTGERQQSQLAARLASENLSSSGAADTGMNAIQQQRGESDASATAGILGSQLAQRQQALQQEMSLAVQSGDAESARQLQAQIQAINLQIQDAHFGQSQGQQNNQFLDNLGLSLAQLQTLGNANAFNAFV